MFKFRCKMVIHASGIFAGCLLICLFVLIFVATAVALPAVRIILDTDLSSDVDDAGAVAVLHALADRGKADILAMMVSSGDLWSGPCLAVLNSRFGRPEIPIGVIGDATVTHESKYTKHIAQRFSADGSSENHITDALQLYRRVLAGQPDGSVTIVSIGYLTNLSRLLKSGPDSYSHLDGKALVNKKVKRLITMGGQFPSGREWNFYQDTAAAKAVVTEWPTPILFSGFEVGSRIKTGKALQAATSADPLRKAYQLFNGLSDRESWDQTAVLLAVDPHHAKYWELSEKGRVNVDSEGNNQWSPERDGPHRFMVWTENTKQLASIVDSLMLEATGAVPLNR